MATKHGILNTRAKRDCIYCKEAIRDDQERVLSTDRSMGYGLIGLSHIPCVPRKEVPDETV